MSNVTESVPGLRYIPTYLAPDIQDQLLTIIDQQPWLTDLKRRVQHYGYRYDYTRRTIDDSLFLGPLPTWAAPLADRLHQEEWIGQRPDQLIINEYLAGQGISSHVDCVPCFGDTILAISLGSPCVIVFSHTQTKQQVPVLLEPGSLVVMQGEARYQWRHSIPATKNRSGCRPNN